MKSAICSLICCNTYFLMHPWCFLIVMYYILFWPYMYWSFACIICRWLSSKEIYQADIKYWRRQITRLMCEMWNYIPPSFFNAQENYLIHQVEEIEKCGLVHRRSMRIVERHLKSLKALVRQRAHLEGSMVEGVIAEITLYYQQVNPLMTSTFWNIYLI